MEKPIKEKYIYSIPVEREDSFLNTKAITKELMKDEYYTEEEIAYFYDLDLKKAVSIISYLVGKDILEPVTLYMESKKLKFSILQIENSKAIDFYKAKKDLILVR